MKKRLIASLILLVMLLQCACSALPVDKSMADRIISSQDVVKVNEEMNNKIRNITAIEKLSLRGGEWGNMTWRQIMDKRKASGELGEDFIVIKNGLKDSAYTRVGLFKYDISDLSVDDIVYATFGMTFTALQNGADIYFDIYWVDENWSSSTVTWKTRPTFVMEEPLIKNVLTTTVAKTEATDALKTLVQSGKKEVALLVAQVTSAAAESRISIAKSNELSFPHFTVYGNSQAKGESYVKQLVENETENQAIWEHAKKMYDEWYADYTALKDKSLYDAEMIVSDESQYTKTSLTYPARPLEGSAIKEHKTRTYAALTDMSKYIDVTASVKLDKYGGFIDPTLRQKATGYFYTTKINGRWWIVDPLGYPCHIRGVHGITYSYDGSNKQRNAVLDQFGTLEKWALSTTRHLTDDLGFNTGAGYSPEIAEIKQGIIKQGGGTTFMSAYAKTLGINNSNGGSTTFSENNTMPVFDPNFESFCEERAATRIAPLANDRDFLGYTTDNELPMQETMLLDYMKISPAKDINHYSYACTWYWMVQMTGKENPTDADITEELKELFRGFVWRRYYDVVCNAVRKYDSNHMLLGTRFLTAVKDAPWVLRFAAEYLDCITINWYGAWQPQAEDIYKFATHTDVPFMVTEFYAKGQENEGGLKNTTGAGWVVKSQKDRGEFYQNFTLRLLEAKNCVGWHWFQYIDNDPEGKATDMSGLDANKGIVSNTHKEYKELTSHMSEINKNAYKLIKYFDTKYAK